MNLTSCFIAVGVILSNIYLVVLTDKHTYQGFTLWTCWLTIPVYAYSHGAAAFVFFNQTLQKSFMATFGGDNLYFCHTFHTVHTIYLIIYTLKHFIYRFMLLT